jgi:hypothetical protein
MSLITSKIRKARKEYVCSFCGCKIAKGEKYSITVNGHEGSVYNEAQLICEAVNGDSAELTPLPYGTKEAAQEANRRYLETKQEFWAGLADHLFDAVAVSEYREHDRAEVNRLRDELCELSKILTETGKQKLDALFEVSKLRDIVRLLEDEYEQLEERDTVCNTDRTRRIEALFREARQALEDGKEIPHEPHAG